MDRPTYPSMTDDYGRALVTDREREILAGEVDVSEKYRGVVATRVRGRIERLKEKEIPALENHATLADELRRAICKDGGES